MWAAAMTDVAAEFAAELDTLSAEERWKATRRIAALTTASNDLLPGNVSPRPKQEDLAVITQHATHQSATPR